MSEIEQTPEQPNRKTSRRKFATAGIAAATIVAGVVAWRVIEAGDAPEPDSLVNCAADPTGQASANVHPGQEGVVFFGDGIQDVDGAIKWTGKVELHRTTESVAVWTEGRSRPTTQIGYAEVPGANATSHILTIMDVQLSPDGKPSQAVPDAYVDVTSAEGYDTHDPFDADNTLTFTYHCDARQQAADIDIGISVLPPSPEA